jgi:hypothetical protein
MQIGHPNPLASNGVRDQETQTLATPEKIKLLVSDLVKELECPVSQLLLSHPVTFTSSGHVFEESTLQTCLEMKPACPVTRMSGDAYTPAYVVANVIEVLTRHFPQLKDEQYDAQHRGLSYREIIDLCLETKFDVAESFLHGRKMKMREYARDVSDHDILTALHLCIVNDSEAMLSFILRSLRFNLGATMNGRGILWVVCNAVHERSLVENYTTWRVQDRERTRCFLAIFELCFDLLRMHQRRSLRDPELAGWYKIAEDPVVRVFTGIDAVGSDIMGDPFIFSLVYLECIYVEKILVFLENVRIFTAKPETLYVAMNSHRSGDSTSWIWSLVLSQNCATTASILSQPASTDEATPPQDVLEKTLLFHPVLFENVAIALESMERCDDPSCGISRILCTPRGSSHCFLTHTLCASNHDDLSWKIQERVYIRVLHLLLRSIGANQKTHDSDLPLPPGVRCGDTVLHVLARNVRSVVSLFRVVANTAGVSLFERNTAGDTFLHLLLENKHPRRYDIIILLGTLMKNRSAACEASDSSSGFSSIGNPVGSEGRTYIEQAADASHPRAVFNALVRLTSTEDLEFVFPNGGTIISRMTAAGCSSRAKLKLVMDRLKRNLPAGERARARQEGAKAGLTPSVLSCLGP